MPLYGNLRRGVLIEETTVNCAAGSKNTITGGLFLTEVNIKW